jgi:transposase
MGPKITVFSGPECRRRWSDEQRLQILTEAFAPGAWPAVQRAQLVGGEP